MARISTYPIDTTVVGNDILIGSDADDANITKNYKIDSIAAYTVATIPAAKVSYNSITSAVSTVAQEPTGLDVPLQVSFDADAITADVEILQNGNIKFLTEGSYLIDLYLNFERQGSSGGVTVTLFRELIDGVQVGPTKGVDLATTGNMIPYETLFPISIDSGSINSIVTFEILRDSSGVDGGGLYPHITASAWDDVPSARVEIYKTEIN